MPWRARMPKSRYASMPNGLFRILGITEEMDKVCFRQHDHEYGTKFRTTGITRWQADWNLAVALHHRGLSFWKVWLIFWGCRFFVFWKWQ